ncbi:uncharacterized protein SPPG_01927 [Spizellomyces punctatus DAOM BR117]|uniref:SMP domain-containing protein n=1 Tax=Spizellomyces punctatus (strain DAOM BR117) TaxID=645134 RepID=A0A0L0HP61_SPIPD|nr:uncharacterized protein SPPG_01927 [Spizellomyces punctatus DAOM BR117]KND02848.1 hypothetical protein SPPG_01927 [Spizellomyces punctatus DAOM BR117]|eukprot:XP_016610887.1 hypothetical protein SPPG_01927 [Spizellomyces punctatus DAOM BR117]
MGSSAFINRNLQKSAILRAHSWLSLNLPPSVTKIIRMGCGTSTQRQNYPAQPVAVPTAIPAHPTESDPAKPGGPKAGSAVVLDKQATASAPDIKADAAGDGATDRQALELATSQPETEVAGENMQTGNNVQDQSKHGSVAALNQQHVPSASTNALDSAKSKAASTNALDKTASVTKSAAALSSAGGQGKTGSTVALNKSAKGSIPALTEQHVPAQKSMPALNSHTNSEVAGVASASGMSEVAVASIESKSRQDIAMGATGTTEQQGVAITVAQSGEVGTSTGGEEKGI